MNQYQYNLGLKFYAVASEHAHRTALRFPDGTSFTYHQLDNISNKFANYLLTQGVKKGDVIAILNEKSGYAYSLMLGCLKLGVVYTNLDISSPLARLQKIIATCNPVLLVFDAKNELVSSAFQHVEINQINLWSEDVLFDVNNCSGEAPRETTNVNGGDPAYIMFTSGSTGFPKGAVMSHNNVLNFIYWGTVTFSVTHDDVFTNANPIYFDNSVFDFYTSIFNGATLVPLGHDLVKNARALVEAINLYGCTIWFSVPSLLVYLLTTKSLSKADFPAVTRISFGGEGFPKNKLKQLFDLYSDRMTLFNVYGPTECTCICSSYVITAADFDNMNELAPLGFIAPNFGYEILPQHESEPHIGELALTGPCVGLGYYNDRERTEKSFVQNQYKPYHQLMYKTGDIVERTSEGYLHFRGRVDNQIKHMGYRIELEEIEAAFSSLSYIDEVGVVYEKISSELGQIKAYISLADSNMSSTAIMQDIKQLLPPYMVPRSISVLEMLPKNANGKIDRKALIK